MKTKNAILLILTAFIWGTAFVAQSVGMDYLGPFTFNGVRSLIGGAALLPCIWFLGVLNGKDTAGKDADGKPDLENIEDDDEFELVSDAFDELLDAAEYDEIVGEDELDDLL